MLVGPVMFCLTLPVRRVVPAGLFPWGGHTNVVTDLFVPVKGHSRKGRGCRGAAPLHAGLGLIQGIFFSMMMDLSLLRLERGG